MTAKTQANEKPKKAHMQTASGQNRSRCPWKTSIVLRDRSGIITCPIHGTRCLRQIQEAVKEAVTLGRV
jgi:hypothetical protein